MLVRSLRTKDRRRPRLSRPMTSSLRWPTTCRYSLRPRGCWRGSPPPRGRMVRMRSRPSLILSPCFRRLGKRGERRRRRLRCSLQPTAATLVRWPRRKTRLQLQRGPMQRRRPGRTRPQACTPRRRRRRRRRRRLLRRRRPQSRRRIQWVRTWSSSLWRSLQLG